MSGLVLSLFPGIGLLDMAFEETGFCVVRGPDLLWGGDVRRFHPPAGKFDGVIGGPPCQAFSQLRHLVESNGYQTAPNLIPEYERVVGEAAPTWFLMENVREAPQPVVAGYFVHSEMVRDVWCGGETNRLRRFCFGTRDGARLRVATEALHRPDPRPAVCASGGYRDVPVAIGGSGKRKKTAANNLGYTNKRILADSLRDQGLPPDFFGKDSPFKADAMQRMVGNGVPLPMGRAVAAAVLNALRQKRGELTDAPPSRASETGALTLTQENQVASVAMGGGGLHGPESARGEPLCLYPKGAEA
jgi:DNA (cytosine-5)-methyltransferase 1